MPLRAGGIFWGAICLSSSGCRDRWMDEARSAVLALPPAALCPPGMVWVAGEGRVGLEGDRYAVVRTVGRSAVVDPQSECPAARRENADAIACWVQTDLTDPVLAPRDVRVEPVCVDAFPFPGRGYAYTADGMTAWDARTLSLALQTGDHGGRRLCTATELQASVAGLKANRAFVYGDRHDPARCPEDQRIGTDPACSNPETGLHEYGAVHSHWVVADAAFVASACDRPPCRAAGNRPLAEGMLVVLGGTGRLQTRQAPLTPHTWHDHGRPTPTGCDAMGHDDQPAICATPSSDWGAHGAEAMAGEARWRALLDVARQTGRMDRMLDAAVDGVACPAR